MGLREDLNTAASTHCPAGASRACNFCRGDRLKAYRFARIAIESLPCRCEIAERLGYPHKRQCDRCRALAELDGR